MSSVVEFQERQQTIEGWGFLSHQISNLKFSSSIKFLGFSSSSYTFSLRQSLSNEGSLEMYNRIANSWNQGEGVHLKKPLLSKLSF